MNYAIKTEIRTPQAKTFAFAAQKTMYGGKHITEGDTVFLFASENEGGHGLVARGVVTSAEAIPRKPGVERQTPRVSVAIERAALAKRALGAKSSNIFPTGTMGGLRPSSTSNSIVKQRTRSSAFWMSRRRSSANSFRRAGRPHRIAPRKRIAQMIRNY